MSDSDQDLPGLYELDAEEKLQDAPLRANIERITVDGTLYKHICTNGNIIQIADMPEKGLSFQIWPSSLTLVNYAEALGAEFWQGKRVLELGTGCGLAGIVIASLGAKVALTDLPQTMDMLEGNILLNKDAVEKAGGFLEAFPLVWGISKLKDLSIEWQNVDVIIAADVIYHRELFQPLLDTLYDIGSQNQEAIILLSHVRRWKSDKLFFNKVKKSFALEEIGASKEKIDQQKSGRGRGIPQLLQFKWKKSNERA